MAFFWNGYTLDDFLFKDFNVKTTEGFVGVCVSLISVSILYEGIRTLRDHIYHRYLVNRRQLKSSDPNNSFTNNQNRRPKRYSKADVSKCKTNQESDEGQSLTLPGHDGSGDLPRNSSLVSTCSTEINQQSVRGEGDVLLRNEDAGEGSSKKCLPESSNPYRGNTLTLPVEVNTGLDSRGWMDLSVSSILHMVYVTIGYTLMLAVMTWNVLILVAVTLGIGIGCFFFGPSRHNGGHSIFWFFNGEDPYHERLLDLRDESKEDSLQSAGCSSATPCQSHNEDGVSMPISNEFKTDVQVHSPEAHNPST